MARNTRRSNGMKKLQPAVMQMQFTVPANSHAYLDLALATSIANRRAYKQENVSYAVSRFEFLKPVGSAATGNVSVFKLPETWTYDNAYQKGRALWHKMNEQVLDDEPSIRGKYSDFKILMDVGMLSDTVQDSMNPTGKILTPVDEGGVLTNADFNAPTTIRADWNYSQLTIPNDTGAAPADYYITGVGPDTTTTKSLIHGYGLSRSRPQSQDPNVPADVGWMTELFDDGDQLEDLREIIEDDNDRPPYAVGPHGNANEFYPGGAAEFPTLQVHSFCSFSTTTVSAKNTIMGGLFQNGLIKLYNNTEADLTMIVHMMPGTHRGYLCEAMDR